MKNKAKQSNTIINYLEEAHFNLVQAAKIAHLKQYKDAQKLSGLIDDLEDLFEREDLTQQSDS